MAQSPSVNEVRSFAFTIVNGSEPAMNIPIGRLYVEETRSAISRSALMDCPPEYAFRIMDADGQIVAQIAAGYWPFVKKVIEDATPLHSPACDEDCRTAIGPISILPGEVRDDGA